MKRLLLPLLSALSLPTAVEANWLLEKTLGIYSSNLEAQTACRKWVSEGGTFYTKQPAMPSIGIKASTMKRFIRGCKHEEETKQWLGIVRTKVKKDKTYDLPFPDKPFRRVEKRFKY